MATPSLAKLCRIALAMLFLILLIAWLLLLSSEARADACVAAPPIVPAQTQWCANIFSTAPFCAPTPDAAALLWLDNRGTQCEPCFAFGADYVCPVLRTDEPSACVPGVSHTHAITLHSRVACTPGYVEHGPGLCAAQDMVDQDAAEARTGGKIERDEHGNILQVERPAGTVLLTSGNYDQHGRPGFVTETLTGDSALIMWPADNSCLPDGLIVDGITLLTKWRQPDRELAGVHFPDGTDYKFGYWRQSEDSLAVSVHTEPSGFVERGVWMSDGKFMGWHTARLRTATAQTLKPFTAAAVPDPGPAHQPGVHYITQAPPISGTAAVTIALTAGAMIAYPMIDRINKQIGTWVHRAFAQEMSPGELAKLDCEEINEHEVKMCHRFARHPKGGNFPDQVAQCFKDAETRYQECINAGSWTGIKTGLHLPGGWIIITPLP